ncbi:MAG TPA: Fe-S cluster assembly ATPase SufC [Candidatus Marinimicrobia bacterium]|jgi:Fe-S cluster assembly ATP-binding protein|nr:Fe-S cluster assembly ATPase SufC [Candidatus Neomarinimicrobiota bacterium]|tara:strand:- start:3892 stop:4632 length:741 start_codon:yes stop_codon:yes gene_type:complete
MIKIKNLQVSIDEKDILKGIDLEIPKGEVHAIMGRNGSGKSTLANTIAGNEKYEVKNGSIHMNNIDITEMSVENRALSGIFVCFQYPVAIPGVSMAYFLRASINAHFEHQGKEEMDAVEFLNKSKKILNELNLDDSFLKRSINDGFSGGEKKKSEILQLLCLNPKFAILDETDSGLDIDALKTVADGVNKFNSKDNSTLIITHYERLLQYINPDVVHVMVDGKIKKSGDMSLAKEVEKKGYSWLLK